MITYGYARVSTDDQNLERQIKAIKEYRQDITETNIFKDKISGKVFSRPEYDAMKVILEHVCQAQQSMGEQGKLVEIVFEELDRLGRNAEGIKKELEWYKSKQICVRILEIPTTLIEVRQENKWVMDLINQILIEVYAVMAEQEVKKRAKSQREGIDIALEKGVKFGRKPIEIDQKEFGLVYQQWKKGEITARGAMQNLGLKANTFYRRVKEYEESNVIPKSQASSASSLKG